MLIDIFGVGKRDDSPDWEDSPFSLDYLSQGQNNFDAIREDDAYEDYADEKTRRRTQTRALELFDDLDARDQTPAAGSIGIMANTYGTDPRLAQRYNQSDEGERKRLRGEVQNGLAWAQTASPLQLADQLAAVKKAQSFDVTHNDFEWDRAYPYDKQNPTFRENEGLHQEEKTSFFPHLGASPESRQKIIDELDAQIHPWPAHMPAADETDTGLDEDFGHLYGPESDKFDAVGSKIGVEPDDQNQDSDDVGTAPTSEPPATPTPKVPVEDGSKTATKLKRSTTVAKDRMDLYEGWHPSQIWVYENVTLPLIEAEAETRKFLNKLGPDVGDRIFGLLDQALAFSPVQDVPDLKQGAGELMEGIDGGDAAKIAAGATALAGALVSLGSPGSYSQYEATVKTFEPLIRKGADKRPGTGKGKSNRELPMASSSGAGYNPPNVKPRPFAEDYPTGARTDEQKNLTHDIDGNPLKVGGRIVGRRVGGGKDEALPATEFDAIAKKGTGRPTKTVTQSAIDGDLGRTKLESTTRNPTQVILAKELSPDDVPLVYGHEIGHVVDQLAGEISTRGLRKELRGLYNTLNNPKRSRDGSQAAAHRELMTPHMMGYEGDDIPREYMAEAIRAYMADPNYIKLVAPRTAKAIRLAVNRNPAVNHMLQFNTVPWAAALPGAAVAAIAGAKSGDDES